MIDDDDDDVDDDDDDDDDTDDDDDDDDDDSQLASPLRRLVSVLTELASALARWPSGLSGC